MKYLSALSLAAVLGLSLVPAAHAQQTGYAGVEYDSAVEAAAKSAQAAQPAPALTGRSTYVAPHHTKSHAVRKDR